MGPAAGVACIGSITVGVAAVFPQFKGSSAWVLGALAAVLAPVGPVAATSLLGDRRARAPALRRLDSLVALGPVWALTAAALKV
jgi:NhaP-type Na+/H+ or K+/H+ antiporter